MKRLKIMITGVVIVLFISLLLYNFGIIGVTASRLEQDARKNQHIVKSWSVEKAVSDNIGAMIFYGDHSDESVYSIYLNRKGFSLGYFFYTGGSEGAIADGVAEFTFLDYGSLLLSMNRDKVKTIVFGNKDISPILVDPTKPFNVILPENCESFELYDVNGKSIPVTVYAY